MIAGDDALGGLLQAIQTMELDDAGIDALVDELAALRQKLPAELSTGEPADHPFSPEQLERSLGDIKALLVNRLLQTGGDG